MSVTVITCIAVAVFPQLSVAVQVLVMALSCGHEPSTIASLKVMVDNVSQLSVAVAIPVAAGSVLAVHSIVKLGGQVFVGGTVSITFIVWMQVVLLPQSSVAVQVLVMVLS